MALSAFDDKTRPPAMPDLDRVLGGSAGLWHELVRYVETSHAPTTQQWNFAGVKFGWSLRLKRNDRIVLYLAPQAGCFLAGIVLGEKLVALKMAP